MSDNSNVEGASTHRALEVPRRRDASRLDGRPAKG